MTRMHHQMVRRRHRDPGGEHRSPTSIASPMLRRVVFKKLVTRMSTVAEVAGSAQKVPKVHPDLTMPTPLSLGYDMRYHSALCDDDEPRPLVVIAGWMGAKERQMRPYLQFYHERNMDTISFAVGPNHVLFPEKAMEQMESVLSAVYAARNGESPTVAVKAPGGKIAKPSKIIFHHFSVGGFLFGQALIAMQKHPHLSQLRSEIKAQIFDSPPDYWSIPKGISRSMGMGGVAEVAIEHTARLYLKLTENTSGVMHRASSHAFHENQVSAPSLWFYSKADPVSDWRDCETVTSKWKSRGTEVEECVWEDTPHIQHARVDPDRYFGTLDRFLRKHNVIEANTGN